MSMVLNTVAANAEANSLKNVVVNGTAPFILNQPLSPLPQTPQSPNIPQLGSQTTPLLSKFIEAQSEIWKHKYVFGFFFSLSSTNDNLHPELVILLKSMVIHCQ